MLFERTAIAELGMIPFTMHSTVLYQSEVGPGVIMSEYQDIKRCEQVKRLKETPPESPLVVFECVSPEERVIVSPKSPEQTVTIRSKLPTQCKQKLIKMLRDNVDMFAWKYSDMTGIPRTIKVGEETFVTKHMLNEDKKISPVQQKKRGWFLTEVPQPQKKVPADTPTTPNDGTLQQLRQEVMGTYATILAETKKWIDAEAEAEAIQIILTRIDNDIYSTV
ncbi:hypothetical protein Tco_0961841, partial [Tanacetum coccineum]